ncbi:acetyl-CoA C-acetyltransferase [Georgenia thermotolerans]|uniref:Acetyl-CoA C-acetyltransferase n=1 Tax=Georgenia thermotolerans TaxID=527326 RepID=A0A7J5UUE0_9MICO|nr:acetyl-CoA C-acetyltransferase [Georgenia thermotolerans]KAE8765892.1 acetyl-CoA C-acetyltransferase [Georgenia thermotolerans]
MPEAVIVAAVRSPIGRAFKGSMVDLRAEDVLAQITRSALAAVPQLDPHTIDEVFLGTGLPAGEQGGNLARVLAVMLGLDGLPGCTVNKYCASSMQTTRMAAQAIRAGDGDVFLSLGVEMVSRIGERSPDPTPAERHPMFAPAEPGNGTWTDPRTQGRVPDVFVSMGETAENVASLLGVSRERMDEFALRSQTLAAQRQEEGFWDVDITPVTLPDGTVLARDDSPRPGTSLDKLAALDPVFRQGGRVTAGNACPLNDGAAALVIMSDVRARELGITPLARIVSTAASALSPEIMGLGPVESSRRALRAAGMSVDDLDLVEINEAFAAQVIPSYEDLGVPLEKVNVNGGAIALGHPFGMSGARITTTLLNSLRWHDKGIGLQTMCVAGGQGMAMVLERLS